MKYVDYAAADFCADPYFIRWVVAPTEESDRFWNRFLRDYPEKEETVLLAIEMLKSFEVHETSLSANEIHSLKSRIWTDISKFDERRDRYRRYRFYALAACVLVVFGGAALWVRLQPRGEWYRTGFGQVREIMLPDSSRITLNANSTLHVTRNTPALREVFLTGEAFFKVSKIPGSRFLVNTGEAKVEVVGTRFNVHSRRENTQVVLEEGQVLMAGENTAPVRMKPGEMALVGKTHPVPSIQSVNSSLFTSWRERVLLLQNTPVSQVLQNLEDTFGVRVEVSRNDWLEKKMSGKLPLTSIHDFVDNLAIILEAEAVQTAGGFRLQEIAAQ